VHYYDNLIVLKTARTPAVLLEAGVILNRGKISGCVPKRCGNASPGRGEGLGTLPRTERLKRF